MRSRGEDRSNPLAVPVATITMILAVHPSVPVRTVKEFTSVPAAVHHLKARRLIGLGVSAAHRDAAVPDIPTIAEAGVPGYEFYDWQGVVAPTGTPRAAIDRMQQALAKALGVAEIRSKIAGAGARPVGSTPEELGELIRKEFATWSVVVKAAGIRMD